MMQVHSPDEYLTLDDLERLCALVLNMILLAPDFAPRAVVPSLGGTCE
jgi:hypothetical protein